MPSNSISTCSKSRFNTFSGFRHFNTYTADFLYLKRGFTATSVSSSILRTYKGVSLLQTKNGLPVPVYAVVYFEKFRADKLMHYLYVRVNDGRWEWTTASSSYPSAQRRNKGNPRMLDGKCGVLIYASVNSMFHEILKKKMWWFEC